MARADSDSQNGGSTSTSKVFRSTIQQFTLAKDDYMSGSGNQNTSA
ncbi:hypothetical protein SNOG_09448 [Parastagonospora nodorum SN15]|uniref:Uncharacterized protein n=1 Tax=Phaeosphaeria nodorum (strain SN15 / ATCC MYA-4574 / FGSC 10173) TaxID=321614 RepID=Q0UFL6_PHANO|nr:hypothetical protein SNOG_09448 [Parastagonospora nodorum SN15]EAT82713.1 hypothetical protein SNOG_09448 [Parastagonospora nodorum SN15]